MPTDNDYTRALRAGRAAAGRRRARKPKPTAVGDAPRLTGVEVRRPPVPDFPPAEVRGEPNWTDRPCFYISVADVVSNAGHVARFGLLAGPFPDHDSALARLDDARRMAEAVNDRAIWYGYGVVEMTSGLWNGTINDLLKLTIDRTGNTDG